MDSWLELPLSLAAVGAEGVQHKGVGRRPGALVYVPGLAIAICQVDILEYPDARSPWPEGVQFKSLVKEGEQGKAWRGAPRSKQSGKVGWRKLRSCKALTKTLAPTAEAEDQSNIIKWQRGLRRKN